MYVKKLTKEQKISCNQNACIDCFQVSKFIEILTRFQCKDIRFIDLI